MTGRRACPAARRRRLMPPAASPARPLLRAAGNARSAGRYGHRAHQASFTDVTYITPSTTRRQFEMLGVGDGEDPPRPEARDIVASIWASGYADSPEPAVVRRPVAGPGIDEFGERDGARVFQMRGRLWERSGAARREAISPRARSARQFERGHAGGGYALTDGIDHLRIGEAATDGRAGALAAVGIAALAGRATGDEIPPAGLAGGLGGEACGEDEEQAQQRQVTGIAQYGLTLAMGGAFCTYRVAR